MLKNIGQNLKKIYLLKDTKYSIIFKSNQF